MAQSYNGWPASPDPASIEVTAAFAVQGVEFPGGCKAGDVATVLGYVAGAIHDRVEELVPGWCWGYSYRANVNNPSQLSCHASGTAIDINAPNHPNGGERYHGWTDAQVAEIYDILLEVSNTVRWGADFTGTSDAMHFEIDTNAGRLAEVAAELGHAEDDMPLTEDDKQFIEEVVEAVVIRELQDFFQLEKRIVTNDRASTPNDVPYSYETALERIIRLVSATFVGESGLPHTD